MKESDLVKKIQTGLLKEYPNSFIVKIHGGPFQTIGLPDLVGCIRRRFVGIEVKLPGKERNLTPRQKLILDKIRDAGGIGLLGTSLEGVIKELEESGL